MVYKKNSEPVTLTLVKREFQELEWIVYLERYVYVFRPSINSYVIYHSKTWKKIMEVKTEKEAQEEVLKLNNGLKTCKYLELLKRYKELHKILKECEGGD